MNQHHRVRICDNLKLNPMEERIIEVKIIDLTNCDTVQFIPKPRFLYEDSILILHALINMKNYKAIMTITNILNRSRIINKNTSIGIIKIELPNSSCFSISFPSSQQQANDHEDIQIPIQIQDTIDEMISHLNQEQQQSLLPILYKYYLLFDTSSPKIVNTHIHHIIPTGNHGSVNSRAYRVNPEKQQIIDNDINSMYRSGLIRPSQSTWSSPCSFVRPEFDYLGHTINANGFQPLNTNIDAVVKVPNPRTTKQVHSFLQTANFYRKFIHNFTDLTRPLRPSQKKNVKFYWGEREQMAWDGLNTALTIPPVCLNFPMRDAKTNKNYPYVLSTDASQFNIAERNYSTFERECLGIVWSVTKLRDYLADESFTFETDQQSARKIHLNRSSTNRKVNNWKLQLQDYDIIAIKHEPETRNCDADYMSRHPLISEEVNDEFDDFSSTTPSFSTSSTPFRLKMLSPLYPHR
ncbi:unnamed protein product [Rotaria sp. Silwood2]|nr:unnamed protein product [Rotaria sp. Silwood2]CAF3015765.1 unnamed protein product [Rotaria sp. Silwood2]CAF3358476.1 unnamed protein product [Rotaria sp. Silwood2]CAF4091060.1 unnamed protein product [Rotaria sp. Silwood2]CAF4149160.1 unnamed protein product [Rotaria sp. Silwood2]